jgi:hypothetical protein
MTRVEDMLLTDLMQFDPAPADPQSGCSRSGAKICQRFTAFLFFEQSC